MKNVKSESIGQFLEFCILAIFFLFSIAVFVAANIYNVKIINWNFHSKFSLLFSVGIFMIPLILSGIKANLSKQQEIWLIPIVLFLIAFLLRYYTVENIGIHTHQVSDYEKAFQYGNPGIGLKGSGYEYFPTWGFYALALKAVFKTFGYSELVGVMTNVVIQSISVALIYWCVYFVENKVRIALYAALFYACWPIHLFYNIVLSSEHFFIFSVLISGFLAILVFKRIVIKSRFRWVLMGAVGFFLGLAGLFKSLDKIMVIAVFILIFIHGIKIINRNTSIIACIKKNKDSVILFLIFLTIYLITNYIGFQIMDREVGINVNRNPSAYYLAVGMNEKRNDWIGHDWQRYQELSLEHNHDYSKVSKIMRRELFEKLKKSNYVDIAFFQEKFLMSWVSNGYFYWITETMNDSSITVAKENWVSIWHPISQVFWIIVMGLCIFITLAFLLLKQNRNNLVMFSILVILGFALMSLFIGVQPRYKCVLYPQFSILAGYGYYIIDKFYYKLICLIQR